MYWKKSIKVGQQELSIETGKMAKQADGSVVVRYGDTILLVTAVSLREKRDVDFLPLTVEYQEKLYSAGRIPGSYFKREGRLTEKETLTSRLIDRSCRPLFPEGYAYETQIIAGVISSDQQNEGDVHGITGASAALWCSDIPFNGPIAGIRVGRVNGQFVANPDAKPGVSNPPGTPIHRPGATTCAPTSTAAARCPSRRCSIRRSPGISTASSSCRVHRNPSTSSVRLRQGTA